ncbi:ABC transporter permease [Brenneria tiliae]|uniref:ABC transporter permease n=1 Tax=Brenneria tiliae TaxID=2914984 RepID=UPI002014BBFE|nr:ABC transporter permease [Brenneria tiliae]MCL2898403.1 ABC transporter permease [Brenneria tiliae]MCL2903055.1 ABC transporter permease [Brenneria tiliae]
MTEHIEQREQSAIGHEMGTDVGAQHYGKRRRISSTLIAGLTIVVLMVAVALLAPFLATHDPIAQDLENQLAAPSLAHFLGTDHLGRDVWSRLVYGARTDLRIGFFAALAPALAGTVIGAVVGFSGGRLEWLTMRIADCLIAFPFYLVVLIVVFAFGSGEAGIYIAFALVGWVPYARVLSAGTADCRRREWAVAAHAAGLGRARIIAVHILPNVIAQPLVIFVSDMVYVIVAIITLGYLGLGIQPPTPDWGSMIADGQSFVTTLWWVPVIPGLAVVFTGIGLSLLADGIAELLRLE